VVGVAVGVLVSVDVAAGDCPLAVRAAPVLPAPQPAVTVMMARSVGT